MGKIFEAKVSIIIHYPHQIQDSFNELISCHDSTSPQDVGCVPATTARRISTSYVECSCMTFLLPLKCDLKTA